jgi:hypothetical protein
MSPVRQRAEQTGRAPRTSKYEAVFQAFENTKRPLSYIEMTDIAQSMGFEIDRANLRSIVHFQKGLGRAHEQGDLYLWGANTEQPSPSPDPKEDDEL